MVKPLKNVIIVSIMIFISITGCIHTEEEEPDKYYLVEYQFRTYKIFEHNDTYTGQPPSFQYDFTVPQNGTSLFLILTWDTSDQGAFTNFETVNFTYTIELVPSRDLSIGCIPSNRTSNSTDIKNERGEITMRCPLNPIPIDKGIRGKDRQDVISKLETGHKGVGLWNMTLEIRPVTRDAFYKPVSNWELTISFEEYYSTIKERS